MAIPATIPGILVILVILATIVASPVTAHAQAPGPLPPASSAPPAYPAPSAYSAPPSGMPPGGSLVMPVAPTHPRRTFSLTISPLHLFAPIVELTGEIRAHDRLGLALVGGAGRITSTGSSGVRVSASVYEIGGQFRYYVLGDFRHGMQLGGELLYLHLSDSNLSAEGAGLAVGPFAGYKYTGDSGFTFDGQLGFQYVGVRATATNGTSTASASDSDIIPLLNINIGWSFG